MIVTDDAALERVLGMPAQDFAEAAARLADAPAWYVERIANWPAGDVPPAPYELAPWYQRGGMWERGAFWPVDRSAAIVTIISARTGRCRLLVHDRDGRALPVVTTRNPAEGRRIADVLLAGLGWET